MGVGTGHYTEEGLGEKEGMEAGSAGKGAGAA